MKSQRPQNMIIAIALAAIAVAAGCGGTKSTASKSAEQYDAAKAKGEPIKTEEGHGGHAAQPDVAETASPAAMDHSAMGHTSPGSPAAHTSAAASAMAGMDHTAMSKAGEPPAMAEHPAMDHSKMPRRTVAPNMEGMDHSKMPMPSSQRKASGSKATGHSGMAGMPGVANAGTPSAQRSSPAMDHSQMAGSGPHTMSGMGQTHPPQPGASATTGHMAHPGSAAPPGAPAMAGMDHSNMTGTNPMPGMQHGAMTTPLPEPPSRAAAPAAPAKTLQPDPLDMPAPTAVEGAARGAAMASEMARGHTMSHGTYRQIDAGRDSAPAPPAGMTPGHQMNHAPTQMPSTGGGHQMHSAPAPSPSSTSPAHPPSGTTQAPAHRHPSSRPQAQPSPPSHDHGPSSAPASPSPRPSPSPKESNE